MRNLIILLLILSVFTGCKSQKQTTADDNLQSESPEGLTMLMSDNYGGSEHEEMQVIRSQGALNKYFTKINRTRKPGIKPPDIDFSTYLAVIYCPGRTYQEIPVKLYTYEASEKQITVAKRKVEVSENQESKALLEPFGLYIMPLTDKEVILHKDSQP